ncbi:predicted protein [Sclerotinia sclerotiorum 1980 UF-70]|uniref:Uncharacterized protein n=1 Tax=Sclerotinia sclerotiorum (strain ATCC 18683 / 1980 / Ss-1) TaxID=665079 RepID=A7E540_SCLS1|nr:predicted protein [Sclerotinia sclerotiorum 1980 UF-70]EDN91012.1 predicted protein [Sclerotinia sclerotiorum 1980 UF-70]
MASKRSTQVQLHCGQPWNNQKKRSPEKMGITIPPPVLPTMARTRLGTALTKVVNVSVPTSCYHKNQKHE